MTRKMAPVRDQVAVLMNGVEYGDEGLRRQMERELRTLLEQDRPLRVYLGIDPTATSLTLGHTVPLRKLRQFQHFGHHAPVRPVAHKAFGEVDGVDLKQARNLPAIHVPGRRRGRCSQRGVGKRCPEQANQKLFHGGQAPAQDALVRG